MTYSEKLKDPKWQRKRLEILSRDKFKCQWCGNGEQTLHVHHKSCSSTGNPWDVANEDLVTLCEDCHWVNHNKEMVMDIRQITYCLVLGGKYKSAIRFLNKVFRELDKINNGKR